MKEISYVVNNTLGIHARPAALLAQCCVNFKSQVRIYLDEKVADGSLKVGFPEIVFCCHGFDFPQKFAGQGSQQAQGVQVTVMVGKDNELLFFFKEAAIGELNPYD